MIFGRYKNKAAKGDIIYLIVDIDTSKWYAKNISTHSFTKTFDTIDDLRDALKLNPEWKTLKQHINELVDLKLAIA